MGTLMHTNLFFLLGGHDLEMLTIRELLQTNVTVRFCDKNLAWGAKASDYRIEIEEAFSTGTTPVLIELEDDLGAHEKGAVLIDHHGPRAAIDAPTSLHQVFELLGLPKEAWTHRMELVAANDRGHIAGMLAVGATQEEIIEIRTADRTAQGITAKEEKAGKSALKTLQSQCNGQLSVIHLPHNRAATVTDRLDPALGGHGYSNLLVISPGEVNFYGKGSIVLSLDKAFPGGWYGGSLPERGFWGHSDSSDEILAFLLEYDYGE